MEKHPEDSSNSDPELLAQLEQLRKENAALKKSIERLNFAVDGTSDGLWYWDIPSGEGWWSERFRELIGYTAEELPATYESWKMLLHPDDLDDVLKVTEQHLEQGEPYTVEYRMRTKNHGYRWFLARGAVQRDDNNRPVHMAGSNQDITERKEAEHSLRLSSEIIEKMAEGVLLTRLDDGVIVYANPRFEKIYGYDPGGLAGKPVAILNASGQRHPGEGAENILRSMKERGFWNGEIRNVKKDGTEFWTWAKVAIFEHREFGSVSLAVVEDITERKEAEHSLRLSSEIIEKMAEGVLLARIDDRTIVYTNPRFDEIFGYDPGELAGRQITILNASSRQHPEATAEEITRSVSEDGFWNGEVHNVKKDGTEFWTWANVAIFEHSEHGTVALTVLGDITDRVRATEALRESEQRLQDILDGIFTFVGIFTTDGVLIKANRAPLEAASVSPEDVLGKPFWETYWWSYSHRVQEQLRDALRRAADGETVRYDVLIRVGESDDGEPILITIDVTFGPLRDADGKVVELVGSAVDITQRVNAEEERRKLEAQVQQTQKLESLGILAGGIAHDFNNLLVSILGNASVALEDLPLESDLAGGVREIEVAAQRAADLCRQLLAYSGMGKFVVEALNLNTLITEMGRLLSVSISKRSAIEYRLEDSLPHINADATQLRQIVMNLITNASEAIGDSDGVITVRTSVRPYSRSELTEILSGGDLPGGDYVCLEVIDTGTGIDAEVLPQLFDPFFTTKFTGRGLGLSAVMGIVRAHGGTLQVASTPGEGTTFTLLFPSAGSVEAKTVETQPDLLSWRSEGVILVVDDEEKIRILAGRMLERTGFTILFAQDGLEAVEVFESHQDEILLVLLDLTMPRMHGEEAFRRIRSMRDDVHVLFSSGYSEEDVLKRLEMETGIAFIQKPYTVSQLRASVRSMIEAK